MSGKRRPSRDQRGGSGSIATVLLVPTFFAIVFLIIQAALVWHGQVTAHAAAAAGAEAERVLQSPAGAGTEAARQIANRGGLTEFSVAVSGSADQVVVTVNGNVPRMITLGDFGQITSTVTMPRERVSNP